MDTPNTESLIYDSKIKEAKDYWVGILSDVVPPSNIVLDYERPNTYVAEYSLVELRIPEELHPGIIKLTNDLPFLVYTLLLSSLIVSLRTHTGNSKVVIGSPAMKELGWPNVLAITCDVNSRLPFRDLLLNVRQILLDAYERQSFPFSRLVRELALEKVENKCPIFDVVVSLDEIHVELPDLKNDITIEFKRNESEISGVIRFNNLLFDRRSIERFREHFLNALSHATKSIETPIFRIDLLSDTERRQVLSGWNDAPGGYFRGKTAHGLFEERVVRAPNHVALIYQDHALTYCELNSRANQMAHYLRAMGVGPDMPVGICMDRGIELIVGVLGILKSGGAYVPLDPNYPLRRLSYMMEDAHVSVLLTQEKQSGRLPAQGSQVVCLDSDWCEIAKQSNQEPVNVTAPENLSYIMYTSGSTGEPKGVLVEHEGVCNLAEAQIEVIEVDENSLVLQYASLSFDASVSEIFKTLLAGGSLYLPEQESLLPGPDLAECLRRQAITTVTLPPAALAVLPNEAYPSLRTIVSAGEACTSQIVSRWSAGRRLLNGYGPTEATVCVSMDECRVGHKPTLGLPLQNKMAYLLGEGLQPVPIGAPGEAYIVGVGLARGYLNSPQITAERIIPDPFSGYPGARMYKSGDLARRLPDGRSEFLGRLDHQVKIRGFRVETGEIEAILSEHPGVRQAVVIAQEDTPGNKRLVAYATPERKDAWLHDPRYRLPNALRAKQINEDEIDLTQDLSVADLRTYLSERLPAYMLPSSFVILYDLPVTTNGKVDRLALPALSRATSVSERPYEEPRNELERALVGMWQSALGVDHIGIHDNFFDLGGDSLQSAVFINQLQERAGQFVQVVAIFDAPTIAELAVYLNKNYPNSIQRICGIELPPGMGGESERVCEEIKRIDESKVVYLRQLIPSLPQLPENRSATTAKNPSAIFIFCPPRTGSTLLRVMLAGHPRLFAPPTLELLSFNTLSERKGALRGRDSHWLEGVVRALMEIKRCDADEADRIIRECENQQLTTQQFYRLLQEWIGEKKLVDKTPYYALDLEVLKRAELYFEDPFYIFLHRHPYGMIHSFEEVRLDLSFRYQQPFTARELGELIWVISCQNILQLLSQVPEPRQYRVKFEDLVSRPEDILRDICRSLNLEFYPEMLKPYQEKERKMTDGVHPLSRMLGDYKFHQHSDIDLGVASRWRDKFTEDFLGDVTWELAESLGYSRNGLGSRKTEPASKDPWLIEAPSQKEDLERIEQKVDRLSEEEIDLLLGGILKESL